MAVNVVKCPSCQRLTPPRSGACFYCGKALSPEAEPPPAPEEPRPLGATAPRFRPQADDRGHYLVVESREPVALEAGKLFVLGRDSRTSLTIHAPDVSRQHAEIDWQGDPPRPILCEVRSRNGTFLNDRRVTRDAPQPLRNGDRIRLGGSFSLLYLNVPPRELRREMEERSQEETRELRLAPRPGETEVLGAAPPAAPASPPRERIEAPAAVSRALPRPPGPRRPAPPEPSSGSYRRTTVLPSSDELESLVAAAMGEAPVALPLEGDLAQISGNELVRQLVEKRVSGLLSVSDGTNAGELVLIEGRCQQATFGRAVGRAALQHVVRLRRGTYRFRPYAPAPSAASVPAASPPADGLDELPPQPLPADPLDEGDLELLPARDLVRALLQEKRTGTLTVFSDGMSGVASFVDGVCERAALGALVGREALDAICALERGTYRFHADAPGGRGPADDLTSGWSEGGWGEVNDWEAPAPPPSRAPVEDPWEVDPNETLMPTAGEVYHDVRPPPPPLPPPPLSLPPAGSNAGGLVLPPALAGPPDPRVPPLRTKRGGLESPLTAPLKGGALRPPPPPVTPPARRVPPPLPPPRETERLRRPAFPPEDEA